MCCVCVCVCVCESNPLHYELNRIVYAHVQFVIALKRCPIDNYAHNRSHNYPSFIKTMELFVTKLIPNIANLKHRTKYTALLIAYIHTYIHIYTTFVTMLVCEVFFLTENYYPNADPSLRGKFSLLWH